MLPATKAVPKEMLPIVNIPIIQHVMDEILWSGFTEVIFVTHASKNSIENHFDKSFELEATLEKRIKRSTLNAVRNISSGKLKITSIRQGEALGLGHAIDCAKPYIDNDEAFAIVLPDRVMNKYKCKLEKDNLAAMKMKFLKYQKSIILTEEIDSGDKEKYGIVETKNINLKSSKLVKISKILEKPKKGLTDSNKAVCGRYIFTSNIFGFIEKNYKKNKEIEITDAIQKMIEKRNVVLTHDLKGECFDCGDKKGYMKAIISYAKRDKDLKKLFN